MASFGAKDIRNLILLGHSGSGKTSLAEALLHRAGIIPKMGSVREGNTVSDYNEDEKERKCSLGSSLISFNYAGKKINIIDTPGYLDFVGEMVGGLRAADVCVVVVNATSGIEIGTEKAYRLAKEMGVPCIFFINMLDKEHSDYDKCFDDIQKKFRKHCVAVDAPIGKESAFKDVFNIVANKGIELLSEEDKAHVKSLGDQLAETVAETDDGPPPPPP
ncbi:MAG: GTP-binding protein, partial [Candidatus Omnitrophica bacterium]|nr:GTP-binding protein [Candidatus Omnitrophota bacterium]